MKNFIKNKGFYFVGIIIILLIWEIVSIVYNNNIVFPSLSEILVAFKNILIRSKTYIIIASTLLRLLISLLISLILAIIFAFLSKISNKFKKIITPFISLIKSIPVASFIIILLVIVGHKYASIFICVFIVFPILYEGIYNSINLINQNIKDEIKMISKTNYLVIKDIYIPLILPYILTSFLQSFSLGIKSLIMAELLTMPKYSIGSEMLSLKNNLNTSEIMEWTLFIAILSLVFELLINEIKNKKYYNE